MKRPRPATFSACVAFLLVTVAGCSDTPDSPETPQPVILDQEISSEQLAAIADGVISDEEYETGYRRYVACMEAEGYRVTDLGRSRNVIEYVIPEGAADADARCYPTEFLDIDRLWQMAHIDDSESADWLRACLEGHGHEPAETYAEMSAQLLESGLTPGDC